MGDATSVVRCIPGEDATNGFFVSCFIRKSKDRKRKTQSESIDRNRRKKKKKSAVEALG